MRSRILVGARTVVALLIVAAIVVQLRSSIDFAGRDGDDDLADVLVNFLSYFTIEANALSAALLLVGAVRLSRDREVSRPYALARASVTTYMVITGVVYNLLLRGLLVQGATVPWSNEVLHVVAPAFVLLDWWLAPDRRPMPTRDSLVVIAFPILWAVYTLVRGPFATDPYLHTDYWYPYPFINPVTAAGGYGTVSAYVVGISVVFVATAAAVLWMSRRTISQG